MGRPKTSEEEDLVPAGFRVFESQKEWLMREAAQRTLSTGKLVRESEIVRELLSKAMKKGTSSKASAEATK